MKKRTESLATRWERTFPGPWSVIAVLLVIASAAIGVCIGIVLMNSGGR